MAKDDQKTDDFSSLEGEAHPASATAVSEIVRRERRRVRRWAIATGMLWVLTSAYLAALLWFYVVLLHPPIHTFLTSTSMPVQSMKPHFALLANLVRAALGWPVLLFAAAASTTAFTLTSRRATLRQIQASLAEIGAEMRRLVPPQR